MIQCYLDQRSGLPPYLQLIRQVRHGLKLGALREGDRLPTVKEVATRLGINQNTVLKAYREMGCDGLVTAQPGVGTFICVTLADALQAAHGPLGQELNRWLAAARNSGLDDESIQALFDATLRFDGSSRLPCEEENVPGAAGTEAVR